MRVLLVNSNQFHQPWPVIPFGLCCVASAVEAAGHEVSVLDLCFSRKPERDITRAVASFHPDVVGVSIRNIDNGAGYKTQFLLENVRTNIILPLKRAFPGPVVIGGPSVGVSGAEMLKFFDLEYAIRGDGEQAMVEFLRRLRAGETPAGLGGLVHRWNGVIVENNPPLAVQNLDALPRPRAWRWVDVGHYVRAGSHLQIQTKRGCALSCAYCTYNRIEGRAWRLRDPRLVADEIEEAIRETGIRKFEFTDSTFNLPLAHCKAVLRELVARNLDVSFRTMGLNPAAVDEELAGLLQAAGFDEVDVGAEAGSDTCLRSLGKNFRKEALARAAALLHARGIAVHWYLLVGAPAETARTLRETFDTIHSVAAPWDLVNVGVGLRVYNGSPIGERMRREGAPEARDNFFRPATLHPEGISLEEVKVLTKREALGRTNWFMYDEDENLPLFVTMTGAALLRAFAPRQPLWRFFIVIRRIQMATGINSLRRRIFEWRRGSIHQCPSSVPEAIPVSFTRERVGGVLAGLSVLATLGLGYFHNPAWFLGTAAVALNMAITSILDRCVVKSVLARMGIPGERDIGWREGKRMAACEPVFVGQTVSPGLPAWERMGSRMKLRSESNIGHPVFPHADHSAEKLAARRSSNISQALRAVTDSVIRGFIPNVPDQVVIRPVQNKEEMDEVYRLTHDAYLERGYCAPQPGGRLVHYPQLDRIPETTVLVALVDGAIVGTNSLTLDGPSGVNADMDFKRECDAIRREGRKVASSWRLATRSFCHDERNVVMSLIRETVIRALEMDVRTCVFILNPRHERVYQRLLNMKTVARSGGTAGLQNAPAVFMRCDVETLPAWCLGTVAVQRGYFARV
ncbi:MAG: radical SAM protein [Planctomycetota bacterium]